MICCVIGGAIAAFISARLARLLWLGPLLARPRKAGADPSEWRLFRESEVEVNV